MFGIVSSFISKISRIFSPAKSNTVYIGNFPYSTNKNELVELFKQFGDIKSIRVIKDSNHKRSKGYGFLTFNEISSANESLKLEGTKFKGRTIRVRISKPLSKNKNS
jgi:RNA recognition motif-containing protein